MPLLDMDGLLGDVFSAARPTDTEFASRSEVLPGVFTMKIVCDDTSWAMVGF